MKNLKGNQYFLVLNVSYSRLLCSRLLHYLSTFYQISNESGLLSKLRKVDFLESLKNNKFVREPYIDVDCT